MTKIIATSDLHGYLPDIEPCDLLLIAGDICPIESDNRQLKAHDKATQEKWILHEFAEWCELQPAKRIVWCAGNHDFGPEMKGFKERVDEGFPKWVTYLKSEVAVVDGLTIFAMPFTPNLPSWAFYASHKAWQWLPEDIPGYTDILMLHSPPKGAMLDGGHPDWATPEPMFKEIVDRIDPKLVLCGHIHEGYGTVKFRDITFANVAHCDQYYNPINKVKEFEL